MLEVVAVGLGVGVLVAVLVGIVVGCLLGRGEGMITDVGVLPTFFAFKSLIAFGKVL